MDKKLSIIRPIVLGLFTLVLIAACVGWITHKTSDDISLSYQEMDPSVLSWTDADTGENYGPDVTVLISVGEKLNLTARLPESLVPDGAISYYDPGLHVTVYVDDRLIYEAGKDGNVTYGKETGALWRSIPLKTDYAGKTIRVSFENLGHSTLPIVPGDMTVSQSNDVVNELLKSSAAALVETVILLILSIVLAAFTFTLYKSGYRGQGKTVGSLALLSLVVAGWIFFDGNLSQLFIHSGTLRYMLSYICFTLVPVFCGGFLLSVLDRGKKVFALLLLSYELLMTIAYCLCLTQVLHISNAILLVQVFVMLEAISGGVIGIITLKKERKAVRFGIPVAVFVMLLVLGHSIGEYYVYHRRSISVYIGAGFLVFLLIITATELADIIRHFQGEVKLRNFREIARVDAVTGGNSRRVASEWLDNADIGFYDSVWFVHMDLTNFNAVNAVVGWGEGDNILRDIYHNNLKYIYTNDLECYAGNAGFIFILTNMEEVDSFCRLLSEELYKYMKEMKKGILINEEYAAIRVKKGDNLNSLLESVMMSYHNPVADFNAKSKCYYYNDACREQARHELEIESKVKDAIENDQFVMYLQPKINPNGDVLGGAEALVRWKTPEGLVPPNEFIPILEKTGKIHEVDLCMFRQVCDYLADRKKKGLPQVVISVNVSKCGITSPDFFDGYLDIINETGAPTEYIEFEFTESMAFDDMIAVGNLIQTMHICGAHVSMDDFGSAYSNIGAVGRLKFDLVKLDKQFFDNGFPKNESDYLLVQGLIKMFHNMKLSVVCEGVEEKEQCEALRDLGADLIQGFYYAKPMSAEEYSNWRPASK